MTTDKDTHDNQPGRPSTGGSVEPASWSDGLKQLYDSVVEEPLPDTFKDLLAQFDADVGAQGRSDASDGGKSA